MMLKCKKIIKKRLFIGLILVLTCIQVFAQQTRTEGYLYAQIQSELISKAYPAVLSTSQEFLDKYSQSIYLDNVYLSRGVALFYSGRNVESQKNLNESQKSPNEETKGVSQYWLGRIAYNEKDYIKAVSLFYDAAKVNFSKNIKNGEDESVLSSVWLYAGRSLYELKEYEQAITVFRYYLATFLPDLHYQEISRLLSSMYYETNQYERLVNFYKKIPLESFSTNSREICQIYTARAYEALGNSVEAYSLYTNLLSSKDTQRSLAALQGAYSIASTNDFISEQDLLDSASQILNSETNSMQNLWVRSGIKAFKQANFEQAQLYFERADTSGPQTGELWEFSGLYQAKILIEENKYRLALAILSERYTKNSVLDAWYLAVQAELEGRSENWQKCEENATFAIKIIEKSDSTTELAKDSTQIYPKSLYEEALYWQGAALYAQGLMREAVTVLEKSSTYSDGGNITFLYTQALYSMGEQAKALSLFTKYFSSNKDTAIAQLKSGQYKQAWATALRADDYYLAGLGAYCSSNWTQASFLFQKALLENKVDSENMSWLNYYYADSLYLQGQYRQALSRFDIFLSSWNLHLKSWNAKMSAAMCAVQIEGQANKKKALTYATEALQSASTLDRKIQSALLVASLYSDASRYDEAAQILEPLTTSYSPETVQVRFQLADVYAANGQLAEADSELEKITTVFSSSDFAREAAYKRGEMYYRAGKYLEAADMFAHFRQNWPVGTFWSAALFLGAESLNKSGNSGRAILLYNDLLEQFPNDTYCFASMDALISLYQEASMYQLALNVAKDMIEKYNDQAKNAGIATKVSELQMLVDGNDEKATKLYIAWTKNNKNETAKGRELSLELASLYTLSIDKQVEVVSMLKNLRLKLESLGADIQENDSDQDFENIKLYAQVLAQLAKIERENGNAQNSAELYVKAAERYAIVGKTDSRDSAARAMYGAVEAFDVAGQYADSKAVYSTMQTSFADSEWTKKASLIVK